MLDDDDDIYFPGSWWLLGDHTIDRRASLIVSMTELPSRFAMARVRAALAFYSAVDAALAVASSDNQKEAALSRAIIVSDPVPAWLVESERLNSQQEG